MIRSSITFLLLVGSAQADPAVIEDATAQKTGGTWNFSVTLSHADTGWDDYADGWRVVLEDGAVLGTRVLAHPHVNEQPFTRSLGGISVPDGISEVFIEARTLNEGWDDARLPLSLK